MSEGAGNKQRGQTAADLIDSILVSPKRLLTLLALFASMAALVIIVMLAFTRLFGVQTKQVQIGGAGSHIVFESIDPGGNAEFVVIVNPEGWQKTPIDVKTGDRISFSANGRIAIDLHEIWSNADLRQKYEEEHAAKEHIRKDDPTESRVPEDYFTPEEREHLILHRPWVDPDGFDLNQFQPSFRSRRSRYLLPDQRAGGLIAGLKGDSDGTPNRSEAFFIGKSKDYLAPRDGWLWFTVNDVQSTDPKNPDLFYTDNVGSFFVRVRVKHR